jgi:mono/diheme cytochrome c family protein
MIKRILKWMGILLLALILGIGVIAAFRQHLTYDAPYPDIKASGDTAVIARGRHLAFGPAHCVACHHNANTDSLLALGLDIPLSGAVKFRLPVGEIFSKNITPDLKTGIGRFTDREIARALRYGVHPDGTVVYDFMPFHNVSDEDMTAIISFLRAQKPVVNEVPENKLNLIGNLVKAFMVKPVGPRGPVPATVQKDTTAAYGQYLTVDVADCKGCHTKRDLSGAYTGEPFAGGMPLQEATGSFVPPNIQNVPGGRIYGWTADAFIARFRRGRVVPHSPMPWGSFKQMTDDELKAIFNFLQTTGKAGAMPKDETPVQVSKNNQDTVQIISAINQSK